jgi:hypothetical protein
VGPTRAEESIAKQAEPVPALRRAVPGPMWPWVKRLSWVELAIFAVLMFFWLVPGADTETFIFGLSHGIGYILLCLVICVAILRHEAPYPLLAATLTPVGPLGSVIAIEVIERRGSADDGAAHRERAEAR